MTFADTTKPAEELVEEILSQNGGLLARDIAKKISVILQREVDRSEINRILYGKLSGQVVQDKQYRWQLRSAAEQQGIKPEAKSPDSTLSKLCKYYLDCLSRDDGGGISLFRDSKYGDPDYMELCSLPIFEESTALFENSVVNRLVSRVRRDQARLNLYVGYPVRVRHIKAKSGWEGYKVEPLFIFQVNYGKGAGPKVETDPRINSEALRGISDIGGGNILEEIAQLSEELGLGADAEEMPEFDELIHRLQQIRSEWNWQEPLDPNKISVTPPVSDLSAEGFYNRAVVFTAERSPYTKGLETELSKLAELAPSEYRESALYHWVENENNSMETDNPDSTLLEVLPLNEEQRMAVQRGLSSPLTVITGPPGTGKSQVVASLLLNAVWKGQKVLFTSKNHKAVDVVEFRANGLSSRPVVMRLGSTDLQSKLAEHLSDLLSIATTAEDHNRYKQAEELSAQYNKKYTVLEGDIAALIKLRNDIDSLEQTIEFSRKQFGDQLFEGFKNVELELLDEGLCNLKKVIQEADRAAQPFYRKLAWPILKKKKFIQAHQSVGKSAGSLSFLNLALPQTALSDESIFAWKNLIKEARGRYATAIKIQDYFRMLDDLKKMKGLPDLIREQAQVTEALGGVSEDLWDAWLKLMPGRLSKEDRKDLQEYASLLKLIVKANVNSESLGKDIFKKYYALFPRIARMFPCWAITSLSVRGKVPFQPCFFDLVVIDEASQCDIASAIPLLYRAKRAVIIGDPKQLRHISTIPEKQDVQLLEKHGVHSNCLGWIYSQTSLYDLAQGLCAPADVVNLRDHHRSHSDIISYSNKQFYGANLRIATRYENLKQLFKDAPAIRWENVQGSVVKPAGGGALNEIECQRIKAFLSQLMIKNYGGSIGVVTPFRDQANRIRDSVYKDEQLTSYLVGREFLVDTVHKFQGDERDLMIFSPVISDGTPQGALLFLNRNGNLFNVAVTRARAALIVIGDKAACANSNISYLTAFCRHVDSLAAAQPKPDQDIYDQGPIYPAVANPETVSDWEKILYAELYKAGVKTMPQYSVEQYRLDLAYKNKDYKLDVEVDGEKYHRSWDGELCRRDKIRNRRLIELGWDVMRFWVYEIRDDLKGCVQRVAERLHLEGARHQFNKE